MRLSRVTIVAAAIVAAVILFGAGTVVGYIAGRATVGRFVDQPGIFARHSDRQGL